MFKKISVLFCFFIFLSYNCISYAYYNVKELNQLQPQYVNVNGGKLEYYRFGKGSPVVLISGYATNVSSWNKYFLTRLAQHHDVIAFNNRDVDGSIINNGGYTAKDLAEDASQLIRGLQLKKPTVVGISMGGMIAQALAALHPDQVGKLVLINTAIAGGHSVPPKEEVENTLLHTPPGKVRRFFLVLDLLAPPGWRVDMAISLVHDSFQPANKIDLLSVNDATLVKQQSLVLGWQKNNVIAKKISQLPMPTLVLSGGADEVIPPVNSEILANTIPHTKLYRFMDGGHAMIYQYPLQIASAINQFISMD